MLKRLFVLLGVAALVALALVPTALAGEGDVEIDGTGHLWARGSGLATLDGGGAVFMAIEGDVTIVDNAGDARVFIRSHGSDREELGSDSSVYQLTDFRGVIGVSGSDFEVTAEGRMKFHARGTGVVFLQGTGIYRTSSGAYGRWTEAGVTLDLGEPSVAR